VLRQRYQRLIDESVEGFLKLVAETERNGWEKISVEKGVQIFRKPPPPPGLMPIIKGIGIVNASPITVLSLLLDITRKKEYDEMFNKGVVIERIDPQTIILHQMYIGFAFVSPRDFLSTSTWRVFPDGTALICGRSITHDKCPPVCLLMSFFPYIHSRII